MSKELETAVQAAKEAGGITLEKFGFLSETDAHLKEYKDFVTEVDRACERRIAEIISAAFPEDGLLGEEEGMAAGRSGRTWIVDPLDGTLNFIHAFPVFSISIALRDETGSLAVAVVYQPVLNELFTAEKGQGAFLNSRRIHVSSRTDPGHLLIATGIPFKEYHYLDAYVSMLKDVARGSAGIRRAGSAALDLAYTACGRFDAFWEYKLFPWDFSAGVLLVREAGGAVTGFSGNEDVYAHHSIVAGTPHTHPLLLAKAGEHFREHL
ncbi:inositol monophosphatase [Prosthecochloris sp. GSB1]|uniref:inositol monophosphatase family protein n=1 Tax=Prosthecochloris sp. GSB1 TaxID=281093 RepID=UPI000B8C7E53|nr:inositol monophosphatase family protein [Prosthecochloris sp. GSB1]ASQ91740.1 inositol monophosphatase [Prosthecochloris sp. GSB1]